MIFCLLEQMDAFLPRIEEHEFSFFSATTEHKWMFVSSSHGAMSLVFYPECNYFLLDACGPKLVHAGKCIATAENTRRHTSYFACYHFISISAFCMEKWSAYKEIARRTGWQKQTHSKNEKYTVFECAVWRSIPVPQSRSLDNRHERQRKLMHMQVHTDCAFMPTVAMCGRDKLVFALRVFFLGRPNGTIIHSAQHRASPEKCTLSSVHLECIYWSIIIIHKRTQINRVSFIKKKIENEISEQKSYSNWEEKPQWQKWDETIVPSRLSPQYTPAYIARRRQ